ncbi:MAG: DUF302 domain-containing protein [Rhodobacteraceae bacterium]|nr:DUF302 domain-containing protein [Paracoccaceae bacterium]
MFKHLFLATLCAFGIQAHAQDVVTYPFDGDFEDATFAVENAIVGQGLKIDYVSHVGEMLNRTAADVGGTKQIFVAADTYLFCSAVLSRKVMEVDPLNLVNCPYSIFAFEDAGGVKVGHRTYSDGPMKEVQALLNDIVQEVLE